MQPYNATSGEVLAELTSAPTGLTTSEASIRFTENGANTLRKPPKPSLLTKFFFQMTEPMVVVLILAAILSALFKEWADTIIILVVVLLNAALGLYQQGKAEEAIESLTRMSTPKCKVKRGGQVEIIDSTAVVKGDIILLEAGDTVPADTRLIETSSLRIEEAMLTGESEAVTKNTEPIIGNNDVPLGDRFNMAYSGSSVVYGRGVGVVTATAMDTELGKIAGMLTSNEYNDTTPLQRALSRLGSILSLGVLVICVLVYVVMTLKGSAMFEALLTAISLAVAAIPEGLVVVVTVLLSIGIKRMSKRSAIIRKLTAVETLGCAEIICSDKTGTITQNKMTVVATYGDDALLARAMAIANDSNKSLNGEWLGDPTETALCVYAEKIVSLDGIERIGDAPFDSIRKRMSVVTRNGDNAIQYTKGALDELLPLCTHIQLSASEPARPITEDDKRLIYERNAAMANDALRVLAAATKEYGTLPTDFSPDALEHGMTYVGMVGMIDPVRGEAVEAVRVCKKAGLRAVMITGDHKDTAIAIAKTLGILTDASQAITGAELAAMTDEEFERRIDTLSVYARVQPEHKVRIVSMWRKKGKVTAMTGDGVNDAPAIKAADIGVGMGITGTDVTKNVADMVLADDNFATIIYAVEEGRRIYDNIRKAVQFLLASNLSEVIAIFIASLMGRTLFAPIHILWINLITDTFPAIALGNEQAEPDIMNRPPRSPKASLFSNGLGVDIIIQGTVIALLTLAAYFIGSVISLDAGMTMAFITMSLGEVFHSFNMRQSRRSLFTKGNAANPSMYYSAIFSLVVTFAVALIPGVNRFFSLAYIPAINYIIAVALALSIIPLVEATKAVRRARER